MLQAFVAVRPAERRDTWAAFVTLFGLIGSHAVLETARDALFLAKVPASRLPWVYLAIAAVSLGVARGQARLGGSLGGRGALVVWTLVAAAVTLGFWAALDALGALGLYALYVWSGVLTSLVLVHFWTLLGDLFSVTQAKRLYGLIGAGSVLGAIAGSGAASALARVLPPGRLVLVSAAGFLVTAALPLAFHPTAQSAGETPAASRRAGGSGVLDDARYVARQPYARAVAWILIASATCLTIADYLFKSTVAARVPAERLGAYFATVYLALNVLSLVSQVGLVGWVLRRFGLSVALAVLPALLSIGGVGLALGGGLAAALSIKGADGALRYSLHRTSTELLFVPLGEEARRRMKAFVDVVGQRGGQAVASVGLLAAAALGAPPAVLAGVLVALALVWAAGAIGLQRHYLDLFRGVLREGKFGRPSDFPELDVASFETLMAALDSQTDAEVIAALDQLEREGKAHAVTALILYHPSVPVVEHALALFTRAGRKNVVPTIDRLLDHDAPRVRAAAIAARTALSPNPRLLNLRLSLEESPEVRAAIVVQLVASDEIVGSEATDRIDGILKRGSPATRVVLAEAIALRRTKSLAGVLPQLARAPELEVRLAAAEAIAKVGAPEYLPALLELLGDERTRTAARAALVRYGDAGFAALEGALRAPALSAAVRWELPKAIALFDPQRAASLLLDHLVSELDGMVRYRSIRALEGLVARNPTITLDMGALRRAIDATVSRAYRYLDRRLTLERGAAEEPRRKTPGHGLLLKILQDKEENAVERLFRLLALALPSEDFDGIYRGLRGGRRDARASSVELLENLLDPPLRGAVVGLVDDLPDAERLAAAGRFHVPARLDYEALLDRMLSSQSRALSDLTVYHIGELGLVGFRARIEALAVAAGGPSSDVARTLEILGAIERGEEARAC